MANNSTFNAKIILLLLLTIAGVVTCNYVSAHHHDTPAPPPAPAPAPAPTDGGGEYSPGTAIAAASGLCVKDWKPGWQKCLSWAMVDEEDSETTHAFGGGITTRVDQFAIHFYGGIEDLEGDDTTWMIGGSLNFR